jgi:hypothetical protein
MRTGYWDFGLLLGKRGNNNEDNNNKISHCATSVSDDLTEGSSAQDFELPFVKFEDIEAATHNFSEAYKIGQGGFGKVYKVFIWPHFFYNNYLAPFSSSRFLISVRLIPNLIRLNCPYDRLIFFYYILRRPWLVVRKLLSKGWVKIQNKELWNSGMKLF